MSSNERIRIEVGFDGGQIMGATVLAQTADELERAVGAGAGPSLAIDADDGRYTLRVDRIVYLKRFARESRVGFGA
jgi:hypothetical protein